MNIKELKTLLEQYPGDMPVVVAGYEGGYNDLSIIKSLNITRDQNKEWYYGQHDDPAKDDPAIKALFLSGENKIAEEE